MVQKRIYNFLSSYQRILGKRKYCSHYCAQMASRGKEKLSLRISHKSLEEKFWSKVNIKKEDECWIWIGAKEISGYGYLKNTRTTSIKAHRLSYELHYGEIPDGLQVCHTCDNPACVNPKHLFLGTIADNMADRDKKGRQYDRRGIKNGRAKLSLENVEEIRKLRNEGWTQQSLADRFNISQNAISKVTRYKTYK
jgi:hypothetical protein